MKRKATQDVGTGRKKPKVAAVARKSSALKDLKPELKYNDVSFNTDASTTETVVALTTLAAGDTALLRDGNKIICKSLDLRIHLTNEAVTQSNTVRFVVVQSIQANGAAPSYFVGASGADVYDASTITARRAVETASRYKVIMDETIVVNQQTGVASSAPSQAYFHKYIKLPDVVTTYPTGSSGIPITNAYYLMYVGSTASGITDCDVSGTVRLRYVG